MRTTRATAHKEGTAGDPRTNEAEVVRLRMSGMEFKEIGHRLGYPDHSAVSRMFSRAMERTVRHAADELRLMESERLDRMLEGLWPKACKGHFKAVELVLRLMERRAKLLGLDAPTEINLRHTITDYAKRRAQELGLDEAQAVAAAERIITHEA